MTPTDTRPRVDVITLGPLKDRTGHVRVMVDGIGVGSFSAKALLRALDSGKPVMMSTVGAATTTAVLAQLRARALRARAHGLSPALLSPAPPGQFIRLAEGVRILARNGQIIAEGADRTTLAELSGHALDKQLRWLHQD